MGEYTLRVKFNASGVRDKIQGNRISATFGDAKRSETIVAEVGSDYRGELEFKNRDGIPGYLSYRSGKTRLGEHFVRDFPEHVFEINVDWYQGRPRIRQKDEEDLPKR